MYTVPLDAFPLWLLVIMTCCLLSSAIEGGYRFGRWRHTQSPNEKDSPVGAMVGSILGLLALVLGFTFSLAASRFDARRQVVLEEANAIGTTYLRSRLLPEPQQTAVMKLLREYVDARLEGVQRHDIREAVVRSEAIHNLLWTEAVAAAKRDEHSITTGIFLQSLNDVIDLHAKRMLVGIRSRIPMVIWVGVLGMAAVGLAAVGYQAGLTVTARSPAMFALVLAFVSVLYLIADLDRGVEGFLQVGQQALIDVQRSMRITPAQ